MGVVVWVGLGRFVLGGEFGQVCFTSLFGLVGLAGWVGVVGWRGCLVWFGSVLFSFQLVCVVGLGGLFFFRVVGCILVGFGRLDMFGLLGWLVGLVCLDGWLSWCGGMTWLNCWFSGWFGCFR